MWIFSGITYCSSVCLSGSHDQSAVVAMFEYRMFKYICFMTWYVLLSSCKIVVSCKILHQVVLRRRKS